MDRIVMMRVLAAAALLGVIAAQGCSPSATGDRPGTVPVTGTVTQAGKPLAGATVNFVASGGSGSAVGVTGADGTYKLTTFESGDGAMPGQYKVTIVKYDAPPAAEGSSSSLPPDPTTTGEYVPPEAGSSEPAAGPKNLLPAKYADPEQSGLTATVTESGENRHDFQIE